jgi:hypothetical protein
MITSFIIHYIRDPKKAGKKANKEFSERWEYSDLFYQETVFAPKSIAVATQV